MDWRKIKTVLIIALIILNICLFIYVYGLNGGKNQSNDILSIDRVQEILNEKNITINCNISNNSISLPSLDIKFKVITPSKDLIEKFLGTYTGEISNELTNYQKNTESLYIIGNKKLEYISASTNKISSEKSILDIAKDYCKNINIDISNYALDIYKNKENTTVTFTQQYNNYKLDNSYVKIHFVDKIISKVEIQEIEEISEKAQVKTIPAVEALLRLMSYDDVNNKEIINVELCYYTIENNEFIQITSTNTNPVWKVQFSDNSYKYLYSFD